MTDPVLVLWMEFLYIYCMTFLVSCLLILLVLWVRGIVDTTYGK